MHLAYEDQEDAAFKSISRAPIWRVTPDKRLRSVMVASKSFDATGPREMIRRWRLSYYAHADLHSPALQHTTLLHEIAIEGRCTPDLTEAVLSDDPESFDVGSCAAPSTLPSTTFRYSDLHAGFLEKRIIVDPASTPMPLFPHPPEISFVDVNRDGTPDIIQAPEILPPLTTTQPDPVQAAVFVVTHHGDTTDTMRPGTIQYPREVQAAPNVPSRLNDFLSTARGFSVVGAWAANDEQDVLFAAQVPEAGGETNPSVFFQAAPLTVDAAAGTWKWMTLETCSSPTAPFPSCLTPQTSHLQVVGDVDGDGYVDGYFRAPPDEGASLPSDYIGITTHAAGVVRWEASSLNVNGFRYDENAPFHQLVDMNGDGVADYLTVTSDGHLIYYPGDGRGSFACSLPQEHCAAQADAGQGSAPQWVALTGATLRDAPPLVTHAQGQTSFADLVHDVTGDGLADILQFVPGGTGPNAGTSIYLWENVDGRSFRRIPDPDHSAITAEVSETRVGFADMDGNGVDDIVLAGVTSDGDDEVVYLDYEAPGLEAPTGDPSDVVVALAPRSGLLTNIDNGYGGKTAIDYQSTIELDAEAATTSLAFPDGVLAPRWDTHVPHGTPVVTEIRRTQAPDFTSRSDLRETDYAYRNPIWDGGERRLAGFEEVIETVFPTGVSTKTTFFSDDCTRYAALPSGAPHPCPATNDNDPNEALIGLPLQRDVFRSTNYLSTQAFEYQLHAIATGSDGRFVRFAHASTTHTYLYDDAPFVPSPQTVPIPVAFMGSDPILSRQLSLAATQGRAHLRTTVARDDHGNLTQSIDFGQVTDALVPIDDPIQRDFVPIEVGEASSWTFRTQDDTLAPATAHAGVPHDEGAHVHYDYDANGDVTRVTATLTGTLPLQRFHAQTGASIAPAPARASQDGAVTLMVANHDPYGNVTDVTGPGALSCVTYGTDPVYAELVTRRDVGVGAGCAPMPAFSTVWIYDRGLARVTEQIAPDGSITSAAYDALGRVKASFEADPGLPAPAATPAATFEYWLSTTESTHATHVVRDMGGTPRNEVDYVDAFGRPLAAIVEADTSAGDPSASLVTYAAKPDEFGAPSLMYRPAFGAALPAGPSQVHFDWPSVASSFASYDFPGRPTQVNDRGRTTEYHYHALSVDVFDAEDLDAAGAHADTPTHVVYDGHGRVASVRREMKANGASETVTTAYDYTSAGAVARVTRSHTTGTDAVVRWMKYDSLGRLVLNAAPDTSSSFAADPNAAAAVAAMRTWRYAYDDAGGLVGTSDARGCGKNLHYDGYHRLIAEDYSPCLPTQPAYSSPNLSTGDGTEVFYVYDRQEAGAAGSGVFAFGRVAAILDRGAHTRFAYDGRGRVTDIERQLALPEGRGGTFGDNPTLSTRYAGTFYHKHLAYDSADRVVEESSGADDEAVLGAGGESKWTTEYDARGLPVRIAGSYGTLATGMVYDADTRPTSETLGDLAQTRITSAYDDHDLTRYTIARAAPALWTQTPTTGNYTLPSSAAEPTTQLTLADTELTHDRVGNVTGLLDHRTASEWTQGHLPGSRCVTYDDFYRTTRVDHAYASATQNDVQVSPYVSTDQTPVAAEAIASGTRVRWQTFAYDWKGNTTATDDDRHARYDRSLGVITNGEATGHPDQLVSAGSTVSASYDPTGNVTELMLALDPSGPTTMTYQWDEIGQLVRATRDDPRVKPPGGAAPSPETPRVIYTFTYAMGARAVALRVDQTTSSFSADVFASLRLEGVEASNGQGGGISRGEEVVYLAGGVARVEGHASALPSPSGASRHVLFLLGDHLGSTSTVIDQETSELVESASYQAYGAVESDYRPSRWDAFRDVNRFTGKEDDVELGLTYFGARYYQQNLGRWMSADPLDVHAGLGDPNPYRYAGGSPLGRVDPLGLDTGGCIGTECGGDTQAPTIGFTFGSGGGGSGSGQTGGGGTGAGGGGTHPYDPPPPPPPPNAVLPGFGPSSPPGASWTSPGATETRWSPNATTPTEAMLLGARSPAAWAALNPHAAAFLRYAISLTATALSADVAVALDENASLDARVAAGAGFLLQLVLAPEAEAGEVATEAEAAFSVGAEAAAGAGGGGITDALGGGGGDGGGGRTLYRLITDAAETPTDNFVSNAAKGLPPRGPELGNSMIHSGISTFDTIEGAASRIPMIERSGRVRVLGIGELRIPGSAPGIGVQQTLGPGHYTITGAPGTIGSYWWFTWLR